jgi:hypothetical protein
MNKSNEKQDFNYIHIVNSNSHLYNGHYNLYAHFGNGHSGTGSGYGFGESFSYGSGRWFCADGSGHFE